MTNLRTGKIARLPSNIRDQLNRRLENGSSASRLLPWLNALPEVRAVLKEHFHSRPINAPNLSKWSQGGYRDWLHVQESHDLAHCVGEHTATFTESHAPLTDTLNHWIATRLILRTRRINALSETDPDAADRLLHKMTRELVALQRAHTQARREQRQRDQLAFEQEQAREKTAADHLSWALHPDNKSRTWRGLVETYPNSFVDTTDEDSEDESSEDTEAQSDEPHSKGLTSHRDDIEDEPEEDFDDHPGDDLDDTSSVDSESGPAAGPVILSEVEGPHTSSPTSNASPHQSAHEGPSQHSKSPSHQPSTINHQPPPSPLSLAAQAAICEQLSANRAQLRLLRVSMGLDLSPAEITARRIQRVFVGQDPDTGEFLPGAIVPPIPTPPGFKPPKTEQQAFSQRVEINTYYKHLRR